MIRLYRLQLPKLLRVKSQPVVRHRQQARSLSVSAKGASENPSRVKRIKPQLVNMSWSVLMLILGGQILYFSEKRKSVEAELKELKSKHEALTNGLADRLSGKNALWIDSAFKSLGVRNSATNRKVISDELGKSIEEAVHFYCDDEEDDFEKLVAEQKRLESLQTEADSLGKEHSARGKAKSSMV
mmetsp:Transcript_12/g.17  ORF Transcript_12/g.17 Transcript_12/m.17 type:complete len:185 (-) Transcript_12:311-865(-)